MTAFQTKPALKYLLAAIIISASAAVFFIGDGLVKTDEELYLPLDDPYIFFVYAENAANGRLFRYNAQDPPSLGVTSLLYYAVCSGSHAAGFQDDRAIWFSHGLAILCLILCLWTAMKLFSRKNIGIPLLAGVMMFLMGKVVWGYFSGMEIALHTTLLFLTCYFYLEKKRMAHLTLLLFLGLIRPEALLLVLIFSLINVYELYREGAKIPRMLSPLVPFILDAGVYLLVFLWVGRFFSTALQKSPFFSSSAGLGFLMMRTNENYSNLLQYLWSYGPGFLVITTLVILGMTRMKKREWILPGVFFFGFFVEGFLAFGMWHHQRYLIPYIPVGIMMFLLGMERILKDKPALARLGRFSFFLFITWTLFYWGDIYGDNCRDIKWSNGKLVKYADNFLEPESILLVSDAGLYKYKTDHYVMDFFGLGSPRLTDANNSGGAGCVFEEIRSFLMNDLPDDLKEKPVYSFTYWSFGARELEHASKWEPGAFLESAEEGDLFLMAAYDNAESELDEDMVEQLKEMNLEWEYMDRPFRYPATIAAYKTVGEDEVTSTLVRGEKNGEDKNLSIELDVPKELTGDKYYRLSVKARDRDYQPYIEADEHVMVRPNRPFHFAIMEKGTNRVKNILNYRSPQEGPGVAEGPLAWLPYYGFFGFRHQMGDDKQFTFLVNPDVYNGTQRPDIAGSRASLPDDVRFTSTTLNIANLNSEKQFDFQFSNLSKERESSSFAERRMEPDESWLLDSGRRITGSLSFTVKNRPEVPLHLLGRFAHVAPVRAIVSVNGAPLEKPWFPPSGKFKKWIYHDYTISEKHLTGNDRITIDVLKSEHPSFGICRLWFCQEKNPEKNDSDDDD